MGYLQRRLGTDQKFWRCGQWTASVGFLMMMLAPPVSLATAQQVVVRDVCSPLAAIHPPASIFVDVPRVAPSGDVDKPEVSKPEVANIEADKTDAANNGGANFAVAATVLGCVLPSPIGVVYNPKITADIRRQYENSLVSANGVTKEAVVSNVILDASVDVTTAPPIFYYRKGDRLPYLTYNAMEKCMQARREDGSICKGNGSIVISLTGGITNQNPFPLSSVTIQCDYLDALGLPKSSVKLSRYTLGPGSGHIPYHDEVIDVLPPHSVVNGISCKVQTAEIWQSTDGIQYLNAPLNPTLEPLAPAPSGSARSHPTSF